MVAETSAAVRAELEELLPIQHPVDRFAIEAASDAMAIRNLIAKYLLGEDEHGRVRGPVDSRGRPRAVLKLWFAANRDVRDWLSQAGATPMARAQMAPNLLEAQQRSEALQAQQRLQERARSRTPRPKR